MDNMDYIVTFYNHFGAVKFHRDLIKQNIFAKTMPVPRKLSSSCGTCVQFTADKDISYFQPYLLPEEIEKIFSVQGEGQYQLIKEYDD